MDPAWSLDYCLSCDRQTSGEIYCSQACRLADLDSGSVSMHSHASPNSPTDAVTPSLLLASIVPSPTQSGFILPPAFDFTAYRRPSPSVTSTRPFSTQFPTSALDNSRPTSRDGRPRVADDGLPHGRAPRMLSPSPSQSSLSSSTASDVAAGEFISSQARCELWHYTNSFDRVRDLRRRLTSS